MQAESRAVEKQEKSIIRGQSRGQEKSEIRGTEVEAGMNSEAKRSGVSSVENGPHDLLKEICYKSVKRAPTHARLCPAQPHTIAGPRAVHRQYSQLLHTSS